MAVDQLALASGLSPAQDAREMFLMICLQHASQLLEQITFEARILFNSQTAEHVLSEIEGFSYNIHKMHLAGTLV